MTFFVGDCGPGGAGGVCRVLHRCHDAIRIRALGRASGAVLEFRLEASRCRTCTQDLDPRRNVLRDRVPDAAVVGHFGDQSVRPLEKPTGCKAAVLRRFRLRAAWRPMMNGRCSQTAPVLNIAYITPRAAAAAALAPSSRAEWRSARTFFRVNSWDQHEGYRYPGWCVPYLARVEIVERTPGGALRTGAR